jgi:hypothetical protein
MEEVFVGDESEDGGVVSSLPGFYDAGVEAALLQRNRGPAMVAGPSASALVAPSRAVPLEDGEAGGAVVFAVVTRGQR